MIPAVENRTKEELKKIYPFEEGDLIELDHKFTPWTAEPYRLVVHYGEDGSGNFATFDLDGKSWKLIRRHT